MSEHEPGQPGQAGQAGGPARGAEGGAGGAGGRGGTGAKGERGRRGPDINEGRSYWMQVGVIPRWQLLILWLTMGAIAAGGGAVAIDASNQVQEQRKASAFDACVDQNKRHDTALKVTLQLIAAPQPGRPKRTGKELQELQVIVDKWVQGLVPKRNCKDRVEEITQEK